MVNPPIEERDPFALGGWVDQQGELPLEPPPEGAWRDALKFASGGLVPAVPNVEFAILSRPAPVNARNMMKGVFDRWLANRREILTRRGQ